MASTDGLDALSVSELRALLSASNVNFKDCVEKVRVVARDWSALPAACRAVTAHLRLASRHAAGSCLQADLVRRARAASLKPGGARGGAAAGSGAPQARAGGAARSGPDTSGARGANDGTPKERELVERCAPQPRAHLWCCEVTVRRLRCRMLRTKDYYELLGVPRTASEDEIKKACVARAASPAQCQGV
jgi:hypothetical protein